MTMYAEIDGSERLPLPGARALGRTNPHSTVHVILKLRRIAPLPKLAGPVTTPMTHTELGAKYGASQADVDAVTTALATHGVRVARTHLASRTVEVTGTVAALESAFGVRLFNYAHADGAYRGRVGSVHVPVALKHIVEGVFGLDNRRAVRRRRHPVRDAVLTRAATPASVPTTWYKPAELAAHYQFPAGDGAGQTVGILEFGGGYFPSDLQAFCSLANIPMPTVKVVSTDGTPTSAKDGAEGEVMLDIEVVGGVCPRATIVTYFAHFSVKGWMSALDAAIHDQTNNPNVISVSWGYAEHQAIWTSQAVKQVNAALLEAAHLGITVCVASGDDGSSDGITDGHAYADFPATSPYVLAVGGTTIPTKGGTQPDITWKEGDGLRADRGGSTGGGVSVYVKRPSWQSAIQINPVNPHAIIGRVVPDLAANADWDASPYLLVVDGQAEPNGGTSAATPLIASMLTLINAQRVAAGKQRVGFVAPVLYQPPTGAPANSATIGSLGCTDVTKGDNITAKIGGFGAATGYDAVSGWGTPIGTKLAGLLP